MNSTVDKTEVNHFDKPNQDWWDESGSFSALHRLTPCRIEYIVQVIKRNIINQQINSSTQICNNLNILDITSLIYIVLEEVQINDSQFWHMNLNYGNNINIVDIVMLVTKILTM